MKELRRVKVLREGQWVQVRMKELKVGEKFRMFEPDGTPVIDSRDNITTEWVVAEQPTEQEDVVSIIIQPR